MVRVRRVGLVGCRRGGAAGALVLSALVLLWSASGARAATTWTVTTTADDTGNASLCSNGRCPTLRDAVAAASSDSGDTIVLPASSQPYQLVKGELALGSNMQIQGAGAGSVTINADGTGRIFEIPTGVTVTISGVTLTGGNSAGVNAGSGGAVYVAGTLNLSDSVVTGNTATTSGGGIDANGTLNVDHSTISDNQVNAGLAIGGGIDCFCTQVTLTDSTISGNTASGGSSNQGGGIQYNSANPLIVSGSTISGNRAGDGGGVYAGGSGIPTFTNSTVTGNSASTQAGGVDAENGISATNATFASNSAPTGAASNIYVNDSTTGGFQNTLLADAGGGGQNCATSGVFPPSSGNNLEDDAAQTCGFTQPSDQSGVPAGLGPLADNGGPTQTMALLPGSAAIDKGATVSSVGTDQRGGPRPQPPGGAYDVGAYEVGAVIDLALSNSGSPDPAAVGQSVTYALRAVNDGPTGTNASSSSDPAYAVTLTDTLPGNVTFQSASASQGSCTASSSTVKCNLGTIGQGAAATVTIKVIPLTPGTLTDTATVSSSALDPNTANNGASASVQVNATPTPGTKPAAVTGGVSSVTVHAATVHGSVNPEGAATAYHFQYGRTTSYGSSTPTQSAGSGTSSRSVRQSLSGLRSNTVYHYRLVAQSAAGTTYGRDRSFRTSRRQFLRVAPARVLPGALVRLYGNASGCPRGDRVTLLSFAFSHQHEFAGEPAVYARVRSSGAFSTTTRIPSGRSARRYGISARCGGGNLGVSANLTVLTRAVPLFTG
jgi:uncharacterized repeat protein (TIGR01451 family)